MCHPQWGKSKHLQGLKLASGSDLGMELMTKRLRDKGFKKAAEYEPLKPIERCGLGWVFIECIERTTGLIESYVATESQGRKKRRVRGTMLYWEFLSRYREMLRWLRPVKLPMIVAPVPGLVNTRADTFRLKLSSVRFPMRNGESVLAGHCHACWVQRMHCRRSDSNWM